MIEFLAILLLILFCCWLLVWYIEFKYWKEVYVHSCGYITEWQFKTRPCSRCGETEGVTKRKIARRNIFGIWEFK